MSNGPTQASSASRPSQGRAIIAWLLLTMVVALLVVNPLWECQDHMDTLRHLGPNGVLVMFLLFACAGITLFKSICWARLAGSRFLALSLNLFPSHRLRTRLLLPSIFSLDARLPLRI